jgi:hypothetical protein
MALVYDHDGSLVSDEKPQEAEAATFFASALHATGGSCAASPSLTRSSSRLQSPTTAINHSVPDLAEKDVAVVIPVITMHPRDDDVHSQSLSSSSPCPHFHVPVFSIAEGEEALLAVPHQGAGAVITAGASCIRLARLRRIPSSISSLIRQQATFTTFSLDRRGESPPAREASSSYASPLRLQTEAAPMNVTEIQAKRQNALLAAEVSELTREVDSLRRAVEVERRLVREAEAHAAVTCRLAEHDLADLEARLSHKTAVTALPSSPFHSHPLHPQGAFGSPSNCELRHTYDDLLGSPVHYSDKYDARVVTPSVLNGGPVSSRIFHGPEDVMDLTGRPESNNYNNNSEKSAALRALTDMQKAIADGEAFIASMQRSRAHTHDSF